MKPIGFHLHVAIVLLVKEVDEVGDMWAVWLQL